MTLDELIEEFYRVRYRNHKLFQVYTPDTPSEMIVGPSPDTKDWIEWRLLERSKHIDTDFDAFEEEIGIQLPSSFKRWHSRYYTLDGDVSLVRLPSIPLNVPFGPLRSAMSGAMYFPENFRKMGYLQFGDDGNDVGPICFHTGAPCENHDYPIYVWDHEGDDEDVSFLSLMFTSFRKLLECVVHHHGGTLPDYEELPEGYAGFKIIDPEGAGRYFNWNSS